jgi:hypothetical protein
MKSTLLALGLVLGAATAHASVYDGYVCTSEYDPTSGTMGNLGYIYVQLYAGPSCSGGMVLQGYFCTTGATSSLCSTRLYTELGINHLADRLAHAADTNQHVQIVTDSLVHFMYAYFRAD